MAMYVAAGWASVRNSEAQGDGSIKWPFVVWVTTAIPLWALVSRWTHKSDLNIVGAVYDFVLLFAYQATLIYMGCSDKFTPKQWLAVALVILGCVIFKTGP